MILLVAQRIYKAVCRSNTCRGRGKGNCSCVSWLQKTAAADSFFDSLAAKYGGKGKGKGKSGKVGASMHRCSW